jgi:hypothetical protein
LLTDILVIILLFSGNIKSKVLRLWYSKYNLSAVIADVLIIVIGIIITRLLYPYIFQNFSLFKFIILAIFVQIIHDILFYKVFTAIPRGTNRMIDTFKDYGNEVGYKAILSDSLMMISSCLFASHLATHNLNTNIILLIVLIYTVPYLIYT